MPPAEPHPLTVRSGDPRVDVQAAMAVLGPEWGFEPVIDIDRREARDEPCPRVGHGPVLRRAVRARPGQAAGAPEPRSTRHARIPERFLIRWRGEADPDHVKAIDAYWISAAEHGMNASTFTARVVASHRADVAAALSAAIGALSGPAARRRAAARAQDARRRRGSWATPTGWVKDALDRGERLMGFGHRVYRAEDPRARVLRRTAREIGAPRFEVAEALEKAALAELKARKPDRVLATNVEFWSAVVLDYGDVPPELFTPDVRLRARRRLVGAHPRAEARGAADPADREVRRSRPETGRSVRLEAVPEDRLPVRRSHAVAGVAAFVGLGVSCCCW